MNTKNLLITGGSRGIGAATAILAAQRGWDVAVNYARDAASAEAVAAQVRALGRRALVVQADVAEEAQVMAMFATIDAELGALRGLVNNAGVVDVAARIDEGSVARWQRMLGVNVIGSMLCAREAVRRMSTRHGGGPWAAAGGGRGGVIVNLSSAAARIGAAGPYVDYAAAKGAIDVFTLGLAREVAVEGILVNAVRPGIIETEIHAPRPPGMLDKMVAAVPMGRLGTPAEVAAAIVWLLSDEAAYVTGALLDVAGGV